VRQRQQEKRKQLSTETLENFKEPDVIVWILSHLLDGNRPDAEFFQCMSTDFLDKVGFYPDYIFSSANFIAALLHPAMHYSLPYVEAIIDVFAPGDSSTACESDCSHIMFISLREAQTLCHLLRKTSKDDLRQRISLYIDNIIDSNGYCSDAVVYREHSTLCFDGHVCKLACSPPDKVNCIIDNPSHLYQGLAFAGLFNCNTQFNVFQTTFVLLRLDQWLRQYEWAAVSHSEYSIVLAFLGFRNESQEKSQSGKLYLTLLTILSFFEGSYATSTTSHS
jgi:hypothetical protein